MLDAFSKQDAWEDWCNVRTLLVERILAGQFVTVLGAGASMGCGLPSWTGLVDDAYLHLETVRNPSHNDDQASEHLLLQVLSGDRKKFARTIQSVLYKALDEQVALENPMLEAIGAIVMLAARRRSGTVITYNFDDLLETYLRYRGFFAYPVIQQPSWHRNEDVTILHPHGFLSRLDAFPSSETITFTQVDFDSQTGQASDLWRQKSVDILERNMPLFIGLSGRDQNLRSIIYESQQRHVSRMDGHLFWGVRICTESDSMIETWHNRGVWCVTVPSFNDTPLKLMEICKYAAEELATRVLKK